MVYNNRRFVEKIVESATQYHSATFTRKGAIYTCVNAFSYHIVRKEQSVYDEMDGLYVDGILMCLLISLMWRRHVPRLSFDMTGMAVDLFEHVNSNGKTIYFVGSKQEAIEATIKQISKTYPGINIAGFRNGYFSSAEDRQKEINNIVTLNPDFVIVGMGSPIQESFCIDLKKAGYKGIAFTCGGFLHQTANGVNYYPKWVNKYNLRGFYRIFNEKGIWRRVYKTLIKFPILFAYDTIRTKLSI